MEGSILDRLAAREHEFGPLNSSARDVSPWRHWTLVRDENQVAWVYFDRADATVNSLSEAVMRELGELFGQLEADLPRGVVLRSTKPGNFCVGADLGEFRGLQDPQEIVTRLEEAHTLVDRLENLACPTLGVIHGTCVGGGLELALCCDYRLALPDAVIGLPEIRLGLHPGLGGTARLTRLIDPVEAMTLMLTGRTLNAERARKAGIVDRIIEERHLLPAVMAMLNGELVESGRPGLKSRLLMTTPARRLEARQMRAKSAEKADPRHYPGPEALIRLWEEHGGDAAAMRHEEIRSFAALLAGETAQNLIRVFFLQEGLKHATRTVRNDIERVHVVGAGSMGGDIAGWCALQGLRVSLFDTESGSLAGAVKRTAELCERRHLKKREAQAVLDRLVPDPDNYGVRHADLVIEAIPEQLDFKRKLYRELEPRMAENAILASNTSSIPLEELASGLENPQRFLGLHFFNPVARMQLVEVVRPDHVATQTLDRAIAFVGRINRLPVTVSSSPGSLVNRVLMPYLLEAIMLLDTGVAPEVIDRAAEDFGMPMGPVELADQVGLDICLAVAEMLGERLETPLPPIPEWLRQRVAAGELGRKTGQGVYRWKEGKAQKNGEVAQVDKDLADRLVLPLLNACMTCLSEQVIADSEQLDGAMVFGTGFAPFRGGPMHYARKRGYDAIGKRLGELATRYGERFKPDTGWAGGS